MDTDNKTDELAKTIWSYAKMGQIVSSADAIIAMGSMDIRVAKRAAELWHQGVAPMVVVAGGLGRLTGNDTSVSEAHIFARVLRAEEVPERAVFIEDKSTNSAENLTLSVRLLREHGVAVTNIVAVTQPYMERRAYATSMKLFPTMKIQMASPTISYEQYPIEKLPKELMINIIVGEIYRMKVYPEKGFTISQSIPSEVLHAAQALVARGYTEQLPR
jgi:uncharacterized SAM-binding protein YcdF (DUF218 family)